MSMPVHDNQVIATCPDCGLRATVLKDRLPALLDRWHREHQRIAESQKQETAS